MSDTPRADAAYAAYTARFLGGQSLRDDEPAEPDGWQFARTLERELASSRVERSPAGPTPLTTALLNEHFLVLDAVLTEEQVRAWTRRDEMLVDLCSVLERRCNELAAGSAPVVQERGEWTCAAGHRNFGSLECSTCGHPYAQIPSVATPLEQARGLLREARSYLPDQRWVGGVENGHYVPAGAAVQELGRRIDAVLDTPPKRRSPEDTEKLYHELLYAVGNKHQGETRHQTALRYIQQAETHTGGPECASGVLQHGEKT